MQMVLLQCIVKVSKLLVVEYGVSVCVCESESEIKWYYTLICVCVTMVTVIG